MRIPGISLFCLLFPGVLTGQNWPVSDLNGHDLKGEVRSVYETVQQLYTDNDSEAIENQTFFASRADFDETGRLQQTTVYKNGQVFSALKYSYAQSSIPVAAVDYNPDGSIYLSIAFDHDAYGYVKTAIYNRVLQKTYNENREPIDLEFYKYYKDLFVKIRVKHDFSGRLLEQQFMRENGEMAYKFTYAYDYRSNLSSTNYYNQHNKLVWRTSNRHDRYGRLERKRVFRNNVLSETIHYTYEVDEQENWTLRRGERIVEDNIFNQFRSDGIEIIQRTITYDQTL